MTKERHSFNWWLACVVVFATLLSSVHGAVCYCNSCTSCTADLNNPSCTKVVLTQDIHLSYPTQICINSPAGFRNKVFDCQGHAFVSPYLQSIGSLTLYNGTISLNTSINVAQPGTQQAFNDKILNCQFINTSIGIVMSNVKNVTVSNTFANSEHLLFLVVASNNISIVNVTMNHSNSFIFIADEYPPPTLLPSLSYLKTNNYAFVIKNVLLKHMMAPTASPVIFYNPGTIGLAADSLPMLFDNISFINDTSGVRFSGDGITQVHFSNWYGKNSPAAFWTWDMSYSMLNNFNMPDLRFEPIYTWNHDYFVNISALEFYIQSNIPPYVSSTYLPDALAFSLFKNINVKFFATYYCYKTNFTNITIENGGGFRLFASVQQPSVYGSTPLQYIIPYGNNFINLTLINNSQYDFFIYPWYYVGYFCPIVAHNTFKNIVSNNGRKIVIGSGVGQTFQGQYAELLLCVNDSTIKNSYVAGSPTKNNDGILLIGYNDKISNVKSVGNYIGLDAICPSAVIQNSTFNENLIGAALFGNVTINNSIFDENVYGGLSTQGMHDSVVLNSELKNNEDFDVLVANPPLWNLFIYYPGLHFSSGSVCYRRVAFKNDKLSENRALGVLNKSYTTYENAVYAEALVCGEGIRVENVTVLGNKTLRNNGMMLIKSKDVVLSHINADNTFMGFVFAGSNYSVLVNSSFSNDKNVGLSFAPFTAKVGSTTITLLSNHNTLNNITAEHDPTGLSFTSASSNTLNNISACFDKKVSFYFDSTSSNNIGADNTGNVTDLGTNPGFSADAGICYLSLLKPVFVPPTPANNSILSSTSITLNATSADPTLTNITLNLYNNTGLVKSVVCTSSPCSYSFTGLKLNENYYFNASACDAEKQCASTGTYTTYLSPTTCALVLVVKNHLNKPLYIDAVKIAGKEYDLDHVLFLPYQSKILRIENNDFCKYLGRVVFLDMTIYFSDSSHMAYEVSGEIALNS